MLANNALYFSLSFSDILIGLLVIAGIVALVFLAKLFISITKITDAIGKTLDDNKSSLDNTLKDLPKITSSISNVLDNANSLVADVKPSVVSVLADVNTVTSKISNVTTNVSDTIEVVGLAAADTASKFTNTVSSATDYFALIKGLLAFFSKRK